MNINRKKGLTKQGIVVKVTENLIVLMTQDGKFKNIQRKSDEFPLIGEKFTYSEPAQGNQPYSWLKFIVYAAAVLLMAIGYSQYSAKAADEAFLVAVDINPSLEIYMDSNYEVLRVDSLNRDAEELTNNLKYKNKDIQELLKDIVVLSLEKGYLNNNEENVIVSSVVDLKTGTKDISADIESTFEGILKEEKLAGNVVVQKEEKEAIAEAHEKNLSLNRNRLYKELNQRGEPSEIEKLNKVPVKALLEQVKQKQERDFAQDPKPDKEEPKASKSKGQENRPSLNKKDDSNGKEPLVPDKKTESVSKDSNLKKKDKEREQDTDRKEKKDKADTLKKGQSKENLKDPNEKGRDSEAKGEPREESVESRESEEELTEDHKTQEQKTEGDKTEDQISVEEQQIPSVKEPVVER